MCFTRMISGNENRKVKNVAITNGNPNRFPCRSISSYNIASETGTARNLCLKSANKSTGITARRKWTYRTERARPRRAMQPFSNTRLANENVFIGLTSGSRESLNYYRAKESVNRTTEAKLRPDKRGIVQ